MRAIHDAVYATPPEDWTMYMARLQHLAEERVGSRLRREQASEDARYAAAMRAAEDG